MRFGFPIGKKGLATRLTALVALLLVLFPSLGSTSVSLSMDICGCSEDTEFACYCCMNEDGHHGQDSDGPCFSHSCKAGQNSNLWIWPQGETAFTPEGSAAVAHIIKSESLYSGNFISVPVRITLIEKPPA